MTHDTGHAKQDRVEEREHGVFVPPDEQHMREDGTPTEPAEAAEAADDNSGVRDPDRVEAIGTETAPATPLDTGTAEDVERAEQARSEDDTAPIERVDDIAAEDETRAAGVDSVNVDRRNVDADHTDTGEVDRNLDPHNVDRRNVDLDRDVDSHNVDRRNVDLDRDVDRAEVAVGTASVPEQSAARQAEGIWPTDLVDDLRSRWDSVQMRFVDDPPGVAADAKALVGEAVTAIRQAIDRLEARMDEAVSDAGDETEHLRQRVAHYRHVFETLLRR